MKKSESSQRRIHYQKLATSRQFLAGSKLLEGPTHYLLTQHGIGEDQFRRFYYRDIEAVMLRRNWTQPILLGVLAVLFGLPSVGGTAVLLAMGESMPWLPAVIFGPFVVILLIAIVAMVWQGGHAKLGIRTRVSETWLATLPWKQALKAVNRLQERVAADQPPMSPEAFAAALAAQQALASSESAPMPMPPSPPTA